MNNLRSIINIEFLVKEDAFKNWRMILFLSFLAVDELDLEDSKAWASIIFNWSYFIFAFIFVVVYTISIKS